jgi:hypothetical protein
MDPTCRVREGGHSEKRLQSWIPAQGGEDKKRSFKQAVLDGFYRMPSSENDLTDKEQDK